MIRITPGQGVHVHCGNGVAIPTWVHCSNARAIIATNIDPEPPMSTEAPYAVIGGNHELVPAINAETRRRKG